MRLFGYPYNNDLVICKASPDYLGAMHFIYKGDGSYLYKVHV